MHKIALVVTIEFKPESKASFLQSLLDHKQRCLASEPGTLQFEVLAPTESAQSVVLFELYASAEALVAHDAGGSLALFIEQAGPLITKVSRQHCSVLSP
ncbi:putative quinol monooxygenase [Acidovorax sp. NB1]|uniref:putative quinol monooxygenase n=1 Tax=Acidovorax sp. NB1 TaxID=1943571 RepID=UPI00148576FA|nr:antibiotic biosynthesis monooxygenase [Acidovorax sp. NB1]